MAFPDAGGGAATGVDEDVDLAVFFDGEFGGGFHLIVEADVRDDARGLAAMLADVFGGLHDAFFIDIDEHDFRAGGGELLSGKKAHA